MSFVIKDRVQETTVTTGTGTVTLLGATQAHQAFSAIGNTNTTCYGILSGNGIDWEVGIGTYTLAGTTLSRTTILASSNSGSAISLVGTSLVFCTNPANQVSANGFYDQLFGAVDGNVVKRVGGVWTGAAAGAGGSGGGLYNQNLSATPTASNTGFGTWVNQGSASVSDTTPGIYLDVDSAHTNWAARKKGVAVPGTPYSFTALISMSGFIGGNAFGGIGWTDGTKIHSIANTFVGGAGWQISINKWTSATVFSAGDANTTSNACGGPVFWLKIRDDGTNVHFMHSADGTNFLDIFSISKASGFLGASGYTDIIFGGGPSGSGKETGITLLSWAQGV